MVAKPLGIGYSLRKDGFKPLAGFPALHAHLPFAIRELGQPAP